MKCYPLFPVLKVGDDSSAYLVLFSPPHVREVEGRDEQVDVLAVDAPGVDALRNELRHEVLAAPGPAVEAEHEGLGRGGVEVMAAD